MEDKDVILSELINKLMELKAVHGDLPVYCVEEAWEYNPRPHIQEAEEVMGEKRPKRIVL